MGGRGYTRVYECVPCSFIEHGREHYCSSTGHVLFRSLNEALGNRLPDHDVISYELASDYVKKITNNALELKERAYCTSLTIEFCCGKQIGRGQVRVYTRVLRTSNVFPTQFGPGQRLFKNLKEAINWNHNDDYHDIVSFEVSEKDICQYEQSVCVYTLTRKIKVDVTPEVYSSSVSICAEPMSLEEGFKYITACDYFNRTGGGKIARIHVPTSIEFTTRVDGDGNVKVSSPTMSIGIFTGDGDCEISAVIDAWKNARETVSKTLAAYEKEKSKCTAVIS